MKIRAPSLFKRLSALLLLSVMTSHSACGQNLFVSDSGSGNIYKFSPNGARSTFASGMSNVWELAFDRDGNLFAADYGADSIYKFTPNGAQSVFANVNFADLNAHGLVFDGNGNLFVTAVPGAYIDEFNSAGSGNNFGPAMTAPSAMTFDRSGNLFVTAIEFVDPGRGGSPYSEGIIYKFTPQGAQSAFASGGAIISSLSYGIAFDTAGNLFYSDYEHGAIYKFTSDGQSSVFASGLNHPAGLAFDNGGILYVADQGSGNIYKFAPDGTQSTFATGLAAPTGLVFAPVAVASASPPRLSIQLAAANKVQISWPGAAGDSWTLCCQRNCGATNLWTVVTNSPTLVGTNYVVTESCASTIAFYRLEQQ